MGFFDKVFGKTEDVAVPDLEEVMQAEGDAVSQPADFYVKKIDLRNEGDGEFAIKELAAKNIILVNLEPMKNQPKRLGGIVSKLKAHATKTNGDIAALSMYLVILTPGNVKIVKTKPKAVKQGMNID
jgi:SepF-like predicted cell division protein (DUF552 family)